jgi:hypothetical protein
MLRRHFPALLAMSAATVARTADSLQSLRGKLSPGVKPSLVGTQGSTLLTGDAGTMLVLGDQRLAGFDFEVVGEPAEPGLFRVGPLHKRAMFVHQGGKRLLVTYWCEVCSIRTFTPGVCMCCQDETALDFKEKLESDDLKSK